MGEAGYHEQGPCHERAGVFSCFANVQLPAAAREDVGEPRRRRTPGLAELAILSCQARFRFAAVFIALSARESCALKEHAC